MLDTLKLSLSEYSVSSDAQLQVQPGLVDNATGELIGNNRLWRADGRTVTGSRAWHNGESFNVTIKANPHQPNAPSLCLVQFSVPKVAEGSNYRATDSEGTRRALAQAEAYLADIGISTNLRSAAVSRLDAFRVAVCSEPYDSYHPVFATLQGQRMRRRDYGRTFLWENTLQEICAYDKLEEMRRNKHSVEGLPPNSLRFELRALKMQKVRSWLGIQNAGELLANLDHLEHEYRAVMEKQLFKGEVTQAAKLTQGQVSEQLAAAKEHCGREWFTAWLHAVAINALGSDLDAVRAAIQDEANSRQAARKMTQKLDKAKLDAVATSVLGSSRRPLGELYTELREKVLA
jgi:hypothetical protein